ncbi:hypothetical protein ES708_23975 [subsurface metagenome]
MNNNSIKKYLLILLVTFINLSCISRNEFDEFKIPGRWDILKVSNITEAGEFINEEKLEYYFLFETNGDFHENIFNRIRNGKWDYKNNLIILNYKKFGRIDYEIVKYYSDTLILRGQLDNIIIEYTLVKSPTSRSSM